MDARRSYMLAHKQDDFAEAPKDAHRSGSYEILYVAPANDNARASLSVRCWNLFRRDCHAWFHWLSERGRTSVFSAIIVRRCDLTDCVTDG